MSVYKSERPEFLAQALKSVWEEQTCKPAQIVLIEDGPLTAGLYTVIDRYKIFSVTECASAGMKPTKD
ncbi:hypothetical protein HMPREF1146_1859 [Prevotella sp. MSX73]|nr:hypothetical protein HMPREF1146_1859 [Prevotella sp. MSX73]